MVILSHAHIDHSGNLPNLYAKGFTGNIYATHATRDLCQIMLADCAQIQESDIEWLNKHRKKEGLEPATPLYTEQDAERCLRQFVTVGYDRPMPVADGVTVTFIDAGHILGSAQVLLDIDDQADGKNKRFLFSGDVGRGGNELLRDPVPVQGCRFPADGKHLRRARARGAAGLRRCTSREIIRQAVMRGGKSSFPSFAVERTQQILFVLHELFERGEIPESRFMWTARWP